MSKTASLTEVRRLPAAAALRLTWTDGHTGDFPYSYLRGWCPCAGCQGHSALALRFHEPASPVVAEDITPVGNYAIAIGWSDGHSTGIYRFDFLRDLCPCAACAAAAAAAAAPGASGAAGSAGDDPAGGGSAG
jgi:DUF971 family protein